ncbi:hypothetical protein [Mesorhizobium atlanticum]|uniref:Uncharacterized protein n=1 Tax=Mesorhizobium atlanticum TaxID=2233532 RepID=A0A330GQS3_9HYPH|nr:hypothetical protein [Mesorhizobium atlanticum]RAZ75848.1 hypothetical protein DPM35_13955 [Mesorhizobium atlanticum]
MSIIVCKIDDVWQEWHGYRTVQKMVSTYTAVYGDGRQVETQCDPYPIEVQIDGDRLQEIYDQGIWSLEEVEAVGAKIALPFEVPEGMQIVGDPTYADVDGIVRQMFAIEAVPPAPPEPSPEQKLDRLLGEYGLTKEDLRGLLA